MTKLPPHLLLALAAAPLASSLSLAQSPHTLTYAPGKSITLSLPAKLDINVAASGLRRVRFLAQSPDGRIFATGMYNLADNTRGSVFILDGWDAKTHTFTHVTRYLDHLRNPNNLAFWTDPATPSVWLYLPLTDRLVRYKYNAGDNSRPPARRRSSRASPTTASTTSTAAGTSRAPSPSPRCTAARASISPPAAPATTAASARSCAPPSCVMDPDGSHLADPCARPAQRRRSAAYTPDLDGGALFATNMGDDHLGDSLPEDTFFELDPTPAPHRRHQLRLADLLLRSWQTGARYHATTVA